MKDRPILFSAPMVRAILEGRKTQTRRVVKPQPANCADLPMAKDLTIASACPYGQREDRLWVRESLYFDLDYGWRYEAEPIDMKLCREDMDRVHSRLAECDFAYSRPACPSIHMPRKASRLTLEVVNVRVEKLQEMTEEDAESEGADFWFDEKHPDHPERPSSVSAFHQLWDSINGKTYPWKDNPWVWVIEFKKL